MSAALTAVYRNQLLKPSNVLSSRPACCAALVAAKTQLWCTCSKVLLTLLNRHSGCKLPQLPQAASCPEPCGLL